MKRSRSGISLIEILIVILVILLMAGLLLPALSQSKKQAKQTTCISNLHQLAASLEMYQSDNGGALPLKSANLASYVKSSAIWRCPEDFVDAGAAKISNPGIATPVSYFGLPNQPKFREEITKADPNHGVFFCVLHGDRTSRFNGDVRSTTSGLVLRARLDGSVQKVKVPYWCSDPSPTGYVRARPDWLLLTDAKCPEMFCSPLTHPCSAE